MSAKLTEKNYILGVKCVVYQIGKNVKTRTVRSSKGNKNPTQSNLLDFSFKIIPVILLFSFI